MLGQVHSLQVRQTVLWQSLAPKQTLLFLGLQKGNRRTSWSAVQRISLCRNLPRLALFPSEIVRLELGRFLLFANLQFPPSGNRERLAVILA